MINISAFSRFFSNRFQKSKKPSRRPTTRARTLLSDIGRSWPVPNREHKAKRRLLNNLCERGTGPSPAFVAFMTLIENLRQDLRFALRTLRLSPGFAVVALLSLALGIGANTAIFQLLNAVRLRSLPVKNPQQLAVVRIAGGNPGLGLSNGYGSDLTYPLWQGIRDRQQAFSGIFAMGKSRFLVGSANEMQPADGLWVSGELFDVLGVKAERGRLFSAADDRPGCAFDTAVISQAFWRRYFGGDASVIGRTLPVLDKRVQIIGITPQAFTGVEVG